MLRSERSAKEVMCRFWMASENTPLKSIIKTIVSTCWFPLRKIQSNKHQINAKSRQNKQITRQSKGLRYKNNAALIQVTNHDFRVFKCHPFFFFMT